MDEFRTLLAQAQAAEAHVNDIQSVLLHIQKQLNCAFLRNQSPAFVEALLAEIWRFLLFSASHATSSIRLASYRATGIFLLRITPYFPRQVQHTFSSISEGSTVDLKSSAVIAASFAFISRTVALPYLERFLDTTPVYHDFAISDPIFSEHLASIISNIGNVGLDWFRTLLHSFLALVATSTDRYLLRSIVAIVKHHPRELVAEVLQFVKEQENMRAYLALVSFVLTSLKRVRFDDFDLYDAACEALDVLGNAEDANLTDIDSSMQILSIQSSSFGLDVEGVDDDNVRLTLSGKGEKKQVVLNVKQYRNRTAFFLLPLPLSYSRPDPEKDGALTLTAKLLCMASAVTKHAELAQSLFEVVEENMRKEYCDIVSACMQAMGKCLPVLLERCDRKRVISVVESAIFTPPVNWFHAADILRVLDAISVEDHRGLFGESADVEIVDLWIRLSLSPNELVGKKAGKALVGAVRESSFERITNRICFDLDTYDRKSLMRLLSLLTMILEKYPNRSKEHLKPTMWVVIELCELYDDDIQVLQVVFEFLSHFEVDVARESLKGCMDVMFAVIFAEINLLSGEVVGESSRFQSCRETVETAWQAMNLDIISDVFLGYESCMGPLLSALKFLAAVIPHISDDAAILRVCRNTVCVFPQITVNILSRFSAKLNPKVSMYLFGDAMRRLEYIQDYSIAVSLCSLFILHEKQYRPIIERSTGLADIAKFALKSGASVSDPQKTTFRAFLWVLHDEEAQQYEQDLEADVLSQCPGLYPAMFGKEVPAEPSVTPETSEAKFTFTAVDQKALETAESSNSALVKTQLSRVLCDFAPERLQELFDRFCGAGDTAGIDAVLRYAAAKRIVIQVDDEAVPAAALASLLRYLVAVESPSAIDLALKHARDGRRAIARTAVGFCSDQYMGQLSDSDKVSKHDLRVLAEALDTKFDMSRLHDFLMKRFNADVSKNKLSYLLVLLDLFLDSGGEVSHESLSKLLEVFQQRFVDLPSVRLARCVKALIPMAPPQQVGPIVDKWLDLFPPISPMAEIIQVAASATKERAAVFDRDSPAKAEELMKRRIPSYFFSGVRLFNLALQQLPEKRILSLMKHCVNLLVQLWPGFMDIFGVAKEIGTSLTAILQNPALKKFHSHVLQNAPRLVPEPVHASFVDVSECLIELSTQTLIDEQVVGRIRQLVTNPMCGVLMSVFVKIVDIAAQKLTAAEAKAYVMKTAERWLDRNLKKFDCYSTADIVLDWLRVIHKYHTIDDMLPLLSDRIFANSNRFFPSFVGVVRFVSQLEPASAEAASAHLKESAPECQAHALALRLVFDKSSAGVALRLASFDADCPESAAIVDTVNHQQFT